VYPRGGIASFLISNSMTVIKATGGGFGKIFKGPKWNAKDYRDLLSLLFLLTKTMKSKGVIALESHIEKPGESTIFARYPKITHDHFAVDFICDTLRMMTMNLEDPHQVEDAMEKQLEKHHHEGAGPGPCPAKPGRRPARPGHRRRRAGRHQDHGLDHRTAGRSGRDDRRRPGRHLPGRVPGLWPGRSVRHPPDRRGRRGRQRSTRSSRRFWSPTCTATPPRSAVEIGRGHVPSPAQPSFAGTGRGAAGQIPNE
jgi:chemotaxis protein MotA